MHIAIEGLDGVGKTTTCRKLAEKIGFKFVEKPLHYLLDSPDKFENYYKIRDYVNMQTNYKFTSWFYGLGNILTYHLFDNQNIITDRHLVSNFLWSGDESSRPVFDCLTKILKNPECTFILYASDAVLEQRLKKREENDPDVKKIPFNKKSIEKMEKFLWNYNMKYFKIDSSNLTLDEVVNEILAILKKEEIF